MMHALLRLLLWILVFAELTSQSLRSEMVFQDGDRVVFFGDSITEQQLYTRFIQSYIFGRYPDLKIEFHNAGWGGDTAEGALQRIERDVLTLRPTVVTLFFGMNDGNYAPYTPEGVDKYASRIEALVEKLAANNIRVILFSQACVDYDKRADLGRNLYNKTLEEQAIVVSRIAKEHNIPFGDIFTEMLAIQTKGKSASPTFTLSLDGVHPSVAGHAVIATLMLKALGAAPPEPYPSLDAGKAKRDPRQEGSYVFDFHQPGPVPLWLPPDCLEALRTAGLTESVMPKIQISNLPEGYYQISGDGGPGSFTNSELEKGVVMSSSNVEAGRWISEAVEAKERNYYKLWRHYLVRNNKGAVVQPEPKRDAFVAALKDIDVAYQKAIDSLRQPEVPAAISLQPGIPPGVGPNLALHKTYASNDPNTYNFGIGGLTDGSIEIGKIFATNDTNNFPKTVDIDLEQTKSVQAVSVFTPNFGSTKTIAVSLSADGATFHEIGSHVFSPLKPGRWNYICPPTSARFVRLTYPDHYDEQIKYSPLFSFTAEVEVYGPK